MKVYVAFPWFNISIFERKSKKISGTFILNQVPYGSDHQPDCKLLVYDTTRHDITITRTSEGKSGLFWFRNRQWLRAQKIKGDQLFSCIPSRSHPFTLHGQLVSPAAYLSSQRSLCTQSHGSTSFKKDSGRQGLVYANKPKCRTTCHLGNVSPSTHRAPSFHVTQHGICHFVAVLHLVHQLPFIGYLRCFQLLLQRMTMYTSSCTCASVFVG